MNDNRAKDRAELSRYLLGELDAEAVDRVAERTFIDREYSDLLEEVEEELIDRCVRNRLTTEERSQFEKQFLNSETRVREVQFAHLIWSYRSQRAALAVPKPEPVSFWAAVRSAFQRQSFAFRLAATFAAIMVLLLPAIATRLWITRGEVQTVAGLMTPQIAPFTDRGPASALKLARGVDTAAMFLAVDNSSERYTVELQQGSNALWRQSGLKAASLNGEPVLIIRLPRNLLQSGQEYTVAWRGDSPSSPAHSARYRIEAE